MKLASRVKHGVLKAGLAGLLVPCLRVVTRRETINLILSLLGTVLWLFPATGAALAAEPKFVIKPVAEKKIAQLPAGDLFWLVENSPSLASAKAAEGPRSMAFEAGGKAWLVTLGPRNGSTDGGSTVAVTYAEANQSMNGHGADTPMQVFNAGNTELDQIVMFVVDASRPFSQRAKFE